MLIVIPDAGSEKQTDETIYANFGYVLSQITNKIQFKHAPCSIYKNFYNSVGSDDDQFKHSCNNQHVGGITNTLRHIRLIFNTHR